MAVGGPNKIYNLCKNVVLGPASKSSIAAACIVCTQKYVLFLSWHQTFYFLSAFIEYWTPPPILHRWDFQDKFNHLEMRHTSKLSFVSNKERNGLILGPLWKLRIPIHWTKQSLSWEDFGKAIIMDMQYLCTNVHHSIFKMAYQQKKNWHHSIKRNWHLCIFGKTTCLEIIEMHTCGDQKKSNDDNNKSKLQHNNHGASNVCTPCSPTTTFV